MVCNRFTPLVVSFVLFGLALGAGKSEADTSAANTASKTLLTVGMAGIVVSLVVLAVGYLRSRSTPSPPDGGGSGRRPRPRSAP